MGQNKVFLDGGTWEKAMELIISEQFIPLRCPYYGMIYFVCKGDILFWRWWQKKAHGVSKSRKGSSSGAYIFSPNRICLVVLCTRIDRTSTHICITYIKWCQWVCVQVFMYMLKYTLAYARVCDREISNRAFDCTWLTPLCPLYCH